MAQASSAIAIIVANACHTPDGRKSRIPCNRCADSLSRFQHPMTSPGGEPVTFSPHRCPTSRTCQRHTRRGNHGIGQSLRVRGCGETHSAYAPRSRNRYAATPNTSGGHCRNAGLGSSHPSTPNLSIASPMVTARSSRISRRGPNGRARDPVYPRKERPPGTKRVPGGRTHPGRCQLTAIFRGVLLGDFIRRTVSTPSLSSAVVRSSTTSPGRATDRPRFIERRSRR